MAITSNIQEIINGLGDFEKNQLPFATSLALNNTANIAMQVMKHKIDEDFNVTASWNKVGGKYGVKKVRATKQRLYVDIYMPDTNTWMEDHETGDERAGLQLIPTRVFKSLYSRLKTNRSIKKKASTLLADKSKNRIFEANIGSHKYLMQRAKGKQDGVRRLRSARTGRLLKAKKVLRRDAVPLFLIKNVVKEKATLEFSKTIKNRFEENISEEFRKAMDYAVWTAR